MKILFGTPHYSTNCHILFAYSLARTIWPAGCKVDFAWSIGAWTSQANNSLVTQAVKGEYDYFVQSSNDCGWKPDAITRMMSHDKDIVCGWSCDRFAPFHPKIFVGIDPEKKLFRRIHKDLPKGLVRVYCVCGEIIVYKVKVFNAIEQPWFAPMWNESLNRQMTDDTSFGMRAYEAGVEMYCDMDIEISHTAEGLYSQGGKIKSLV